MNSIQANATSIVIKLTIDEQRDYVMIQIIDNGNGFATGTLTNAINPFFTTKPNNKTGLGLSLFYESTIHCNGTFSIESKQGLGCCITATYQLNHINLIPFGDLTATISTSILSNPFIEFSFTYFYNNKQFTLDTLQLKAQFMQNSNHQITYYEYIKHELQTKLQSLPSNFFFYHNSKFKNA